MPTSRPDTSAQTCVAPFSAGRERTTVAVPAGACDCHIHVYDARYPAVPGARLTPPDATVADYRKVQQRMRTQRAVFVTPSTYGTDNRPMLAALAAFSQEAGTPGRGVAVVDAGIPDTELQAMHAAGVRGIRVNLSLGSVPGVAQMLPLAERIGALGWHVQLLAPAATLLALEETLWRLPVPLVLDHFARIVPATFANDPAHTLVLRLLGEGRAWIKLSGGYIVTEQGPPLYADVAPLARSYLRAAPDRVVWGSDWPHASATAGHQPLPDDALQMTRLAEWPGDSTLLRRVLVDNPARLYGFPLMSKETP